MKKTALCIMALGLSLAFCPLQSNAEVNIVAPSSMVVAGPGDANSSLARLNEIKAMDKSNLSGAEKRELRKEVKSIKREMQHTNKGVYLSVGAIIIIILLLILIL